MNIYHKRAIFRRRDDPSVYRMFFWVILILGGIWLIRSVQQGDVKPLFLPTATPTRFAGSYVLEAEALFTAGKLEDTKDSNGNVLSGGAISSYLEAVKVDPNNVKVWADLARVQTYSSAMIVNRDDIKARLAEALESAKKAVELAPDDSYAHAVYAFTLDWNANTNLVDADTAQKLLIAADGEAAQALLLDPTNTLALAFSAEILVDQQKWTQAQQNIEKALQSDASLMDVHRINAYVLESFGEYALAIEAYDRAIAITPNLTFLHMYAGANYRVLAAKYDNPDDEVPKRLYLKSLEYFDRAATINNQLGVQDPLPYLSIAKTYSQMGQFFIAIRNVQKTIEFQPSRAELYGELGVLYHKNRNYETGVLALECAVRGCTAEQSCPARGDCGSSDVAADVVGLPLTGSTVYFYDIYASELSALSPLKGNENYCSRALEVVSEIEASELDNDANIAADIVVVRNICSFVPEPDVNGDLTATVEPVVIDITPTATP